MTPAAQAGARAPIAGWNESSREGRMTLALWALLIGTLMVTMVVAGTMLGRLALTSAMVYLALGWLLGPAVGDVLRPNPSGPTALLETGAEVALVISLFAVGMQLGVPLDDRRWWLSARLALLSMTAMVAMAATIGVWLLHLPLGAAVLLGAVLAPTDPVLASGMRSQSGTQPDPLGFTLGAEGGLNDATAFPFVVLGLGWLGLHDLGPWLLRWWVIDLVWTCLGGVAIGAALGVATGRLVVHLRTTYRQALGLDVFIGLGLIGMAYGAANVCAASGFLAVFAAGLALQRIRGRTGSAARQERMAGEMQDSVQAFNEQLEKVAELALVLMVGAMLGYTQPPSAWWFVPLALLLRPLSVLASGPLGMLSAPQRTMISWFGIRGIGSVYYMLYAVRQGLAPDVAATLVTLTLWTVAASIVVHGLTAGPLMKWYVAQERV